jgi:thiamine pyrophosphate-dependent acetolactate synthase large subunit-like protein
MEYWLQYRVSSRSAGDKPNRGEQTMLVMNVIAEILKSEGVSTLFCYPTTPIIEAAAAIGIRPVICRQERVGVHMADGFARVANGRPPGVFAMQYGPGAENAFAGVATAFSDSTPVLFLPLGHPRETAQLFPMFKSSRSYAAITKSVEEVQLPHEVGNIMRRAFAQLKNGRPGPVMVEVPADVMGLDVEVDPNAHRPIRPTRSAGDPGDIDQAARMLLAASCPMILAGQGVLYAEATEELRRLAELVQAPAMTTFDGKSAFPEDHALALGPGGGTFTGHGRHILHKSDLVLGIGCSFTRHGIATPVLPPKKQIIHVTNDTRDLHKAFAADLGILGDARLVLGQLIEAVGDRLGGKERANGLAREVGEQREAWLARWQAKLYSNERPINPYRVVTEFIRVVDPAEAIVTHDSGSPREQLNPFYRATRPRGYLGWGKSHQLGTGLGLAIGAKLAAPDKFCVNFMGDAAFGMTGLDFETAVRCGVPITTIVLNNSSMAIETHAMQLSHERYRSRDIGGNYANIARDLGGWGERVEDPAAIGAAIGRARRQNDDGRAALLEFVTSEEQRFSHRRGAAE